MSKHNISAIVTSFMISSTIFGSIPFRHSSLSPSMLVSDLVEDEPLLHPVFNTALVIVLTAWLLQTR